MLTGDKKVDAPIRDLMKELGSEKSLGSFRMNYDKDKGAFIYDEGDSKTLPLYQAAGGTKNKPKPIYDGKKPKYVEQSYDLIDSPAMVNHDGTPPEDTTKPDWESLPYAVSGPDQKKIEAAIDSGAVDAIANRIVARTQEAMKNPEIAAGAGWYSRMRDKLLAALGPQGREIFSQLLGATSAQTPVNENFLQGVDAKEGIDTGRYDQNRKDYLETRAAEENGTLNDIIRDRGYIDILQAKVKAWDKLARSTKLKAAEKQAAKAESARLKELISIPEESRTETQRFNIAAQATNMLPVRSNGKKFNANSLAVLKVIAGTWLDGAEAPKTPNFAGNLSGRTLQATIDVWAARELREIMHQGTGLPYRIQPKAEQGVDNGDFALGQIVMERAAKKLGMNPDDLQAILWFAGKHRWEEEGWTKNQGAEKSSFDDIFHVFFPEGEKPRTFAEGSEILKNMKESKEDEETEE